LLGQCDGLWHVFEKPGKFIEKESVEIRINGGCMMEEALDTNKNRDNSIF